MSQQSFCHCLFRGLPRSYRPGIVARDHVRRCRDCARRCARDISGPSAPNGDQSAPAGAAGAGTAAGAAAVAAAAQEPPGEPPRRPPAQRGGVRRAVCAASAAPALAAAAAGGGGAMAAGAMPAVAVATCATAAGGAVGRGLVATLSISSSDSSPSVNRTRSGPHFGHEQTVDLLAGLHAPRLVAGDLAQEGRALAIDHHGAGQRELAALQPFGASLRTAGAGRRVGLKSVRCTVSVRAATPPVDREFGQERCHDRLRRDRLRGWRVLCHRAAPVGLPADHRRESGERKEPPESRPERECRVGSRSHFLSGSASAKAATSS